MKENIGVIVTLAASAIFLIAFAMYNKDIFIGKSKPSFVSWMMFSIITLINSSSYQEMSGDWVKAVVAYTDCFICITTFVVLLLRQAKGSKLTKLDIGILIICLSSISIWWILKSATYANILLQISYVVGFYPTYKGVLENPKNEPAKPWFLWSIAFILSIVVVILRWESNIADIINPMVCFLLHLGVGIIASFKKQE